MITKGLGSNRLITKGMGIRAIISSWIDKLDLSLTVRKGINFILRV
jgi:hypothetical protein